jgi:hypothetical protein
MDRQRAPRPGRRAGAPTRAPRRRSGSQRPWATPLEYDESGFPIAARVPTFVERVRRLLVVP